MAKNKTTENNNSVKEYLDAIADEKKRKDCAEIISLIKKETKLEPKMWGTGIVGFGTYHYKYESGHEGDAPLAGVAARTNAIVLYFSLPPAQKEELLHKFGKHKTGKGCIYIKKMEDINPEVITEMAKISIEDLRNKYPANT